MEISILKIGMTHMMISVEKTWLVLKLNHYFFSICNARQKSQKVGAAWSSRLHHSSKNDYLKRVSGKA